MVKVYSVRMDGLSRKIIMALFASFLMIACFSGLAAKSVHAAPPSDGTTWTQDLSMSDEFNGTSVDTSKWGIDNLWFSTSDYSAFKDSNVTESGGYLNIQGKKETYNGKSYTTGAVMSNFQVPGQTSYVEVSAKMPNFNSNLSGDVWMMGTPSVASNPNPEIDMQESVDYGNAHVSNHLHTWFYNADGTYTHTDLGGNDYNTGVNLDAGFHTYGLERINGVLNFYLDGTLTWSVSPSDSSFSTYGRNLILYRLNL